MEKKIRRLSVLNSFFMLIIVVLVSTALTAKHEKKQDILRARGLIIEDSLGRERILIGAPTPFAKNRVRTNTKRAMEAWEKYFAKGYREFYKDYNHQANGIIILDENGFDKVAIGDPTPDPNIGKRIGPASGIDFYDQLGFERGGLGLLNVNGVNRVVLGLDSKYGNEGMYMMLDDNGTTSLGIRNGKNEIFMGQVPASYLDDKWQGIFHGLMIKDSSGVKFKMNTEDKKE